MTRKAISKKQNHFVKLSVTDGYFHVNPDTIIYFDVGGLSFINEGSGATNAVDYSFDGYYQHGDMIPGKSSASLYFENRAVSTIWFRTSSGSTGPITVRIEAWRKSD